MSLCVRPGQVSKTPGLQQEHEGGLNTIGLMDENLLAAGGLADVVARTGAQNAGFGGTRRMTMIRQHYEPGGKHYPHEHAEGEQAYYLESGRARVRVGEDTFDVGAGDVVYIPPRTDHEFENIGDEVCVNILISVGLGEADRK